MNLTSSLIHESTQILIQDEQTSYIKPHINIGSNQPIDLKGMHLHMFSSSKI
jgi:hypothetical protein